MYVPNAFVESRLDILQDAISACGLAIFVTVRNGVPAATHVPMLLDPDEGTYGTLHFHLARANSQWRDAAPGAAALAVFPGPDGYISPSWYASKAAHGRVVPTWNYVTVHAEGVPRFYDEPDALQALVTRLTARHEAAQPTPWQVADAPKPYIDSMLRAVVGVALPIAKLEGAWKLGQNKTDADRAGLLAGFAAEGAAYDELADATRAAWDRS